MATDCSWNYREKYNCRTWAEPCCFHGNLMNNLMSYYGSVDARISVSEKDLLVIYGSLTVLVQHTC